jgi:hypothetical protein
MGERSRVCKFSYERIHASNVVSTSNISRLTSTTNAGKSILTTMQQRPRLPKPTRRDPKPIELSHRLHPHRLRPISMCSSLHLQQRLHLLQPLHGAYTKFPAQRILPLSTGSNKDLLRPLHRHFRRQHCYQRRSIPARFSRRHRGIQRLR